MRYFHALQVMDFFLQEKDPMVVLHRNKPKTGRTVSVPWVINALYGMDGSAYSHICGNVTLLQYIISLL